MNAKFAWLVLVVVAIAVESPVGAADAAAGSSLDATVRRLEKLAGEFEDRRDVKCWTSFKQLEKFVAGCQLSPVSTHLKAVVVMNYMDQIWQAAAAGGDEPRTVVDLARFDSVVAKTVPHERVGLLRYTVKLGDRSVDVPYQDVENYHGTVEPIRLMQSLAQRVARQDPQRPGLSFDAIDSACHLSSLLSTVLLKEANIVSSEAQHATIVEEDVFGADRRVAKALGLAAYDPDKAADTPAAPVAETWHTNMMTTIGQKIHALDTFNTEYSRKRLNMTFNEDLAVHEADWAEMPVDRDASELYKRTQLVDACHYLYAETRKTFPDHRIVNGPEMFAVIMAHYPFITTYSGRVALFPDSEGASAGWVEEYQADSLRDTGWHWKAIDIVMKELIAAGEEMPELDLYALEELSEFLSVYGVMLVKDAGRLAAAAGQDRVDLAMMKKSHEEFGRRRAAAAAAPPPKITAPKPSDHAERTKRVREALGQVYIGEFFTDVTDDTGITFEHESSDMVQEFRFTPRKKRDYILKEEFPIASTKYPFVEIGIAGGGVAVADVDGDKRLDIYLVNGKGDRLYKNLGGLRFKDVTAESGLGSEKEGRGAYFGDYDNDGDPDLFVSHVYAPNRLYRNGGDGVFTDVTAAVGLPLHTNVVSHSCVWFDYDNDGDLDMYVGNFGDWLGGVRHLVGDNSRNGRPNALYRNNGGTFEDVTAQTEAGDVGWAHALSHLDANNDGWQDLYLSNDFGEDVLLLNIRGERFVDATPDSLKRNFLHGMSVSFTDFNRDGIDDIYISNIAMFSFVTKLIKPDARTKTPVSRRTVDNLRMAECNLFLVSAGATYFDKHKDFFDRSAEGCGWAWDADFFDFDNNGVDDLYLVNGREPNMGYSRERNILFSQADGHFYDVSRDSGADYRGNSRGTAYADFDDDGDLDIIVNNYHAKATLLRNNLQRNNWVRIRLEGDKSNRDGVGARVKLYTAAGMQHRTVRGGSGFLSQDPFVLHFGLRDQKDIEKFEIEWPSGRKQTITSPAINREHRVREPS